MEGDLSLQGGEVRQDAVHQSHLHNPAGKYYIRSQYFSLSLYFVSKPSRMSLMDLTVLSHLSVRLRHSAPKNLQRRKIRILIFIKSTNLILGSTRRDSSMEALLETKKEYSFISSDQVYDLPR